MFEAQDKVIYAEIKEGQYTKRFVFPAEESLVDKIKHLEEDHPVEIQNIGKGVITQVIIRDSDGEEVLKSLPSRINGLYQVDFVGHPDVQTGQARYSEGLLEYIEEIELGGVKMVEQDDLPEPPAEKPKSLTEQLKAQVKKGPELETDAIPGQMSLEDFITEKKEEKKLPSLEEKVASARKEKGANKLPLSQVIPVSDSFVITEQSNNNISEILRIVQSLDKAFRGEQTDISGRELARWFADYSYENGADKAWDYIASKVLDW